MSHRGLKFGIFLAPFHRVLQEFPTRSSWRDCDIGVKKLGWR